MILIERFRITFTSNGKLEFAPRDQLSLYCCLLFMKFTQNLVHHFYSLEFFWVVSFRFWGILNLNQTFAVLSEAQNLSTIWFLRKCRDSQTAYNQGQFLFFSKTFILFCSQGYVGQIVSRNVMLNLSVLLVIWGMFFFFSVLNSGRWSKRIQL